MRCFALQKDELYRTFSLVAFQPRKLVTAPIPCKALHRKCLFCCHSRIRNGAAVCTGYLLLYLNVHVQSNIFNAGEDMSCYSVGDSGRCLAAMNYRIRGVGDCACGDQLIQLDRCRTESPARSSFAMQSIAVLNLFFNKKGDACRIAGHTETERGFISLQEALLRHLSPPYQPFSPAL